MIKTILCDLGDVIVYVDHDKIVEGLAKHSNKDKRYIHNYFYHTLTRKGFDKGKLGAKEFFTNYKNKLNLKLSFNQFKKIWCSCFTGVNKEMENILKIVGMTAEKIVFTNAHEKGGFQ